MAVMTTKTSKWRASHSERGGTKGAEVPAAPGRLAGGWGDTEGWGSTEGREAGYAMTIASKESPGSLGAAARITRPGDSKEKMSEPVFFVRL